MKTIFAISLAIVALGATSAWADQSVRGYFKSDGTYVQPYMRSSPDSSYNDNWSVSPNVNPYTGKEGTNRVRKNLPGWRRFADQGGVGALSG